MEHDQPQGQPNFNAIAADQSPLNVSIKEEIKVAAANETNRSEVEDLATSSFFRAIATIPSPSNASNRNSGIRFSGASMT